MNTQPISFKAQEVPGKGWTVVKVTGTKRTGRTIDKVGFPETYTFHQAVVAAENAQRDYRRHGLYA